MKYNFNGKEINIPDGDIKKLMVSLDIPKDEAIDVWLDDHDYTDNEEAEAMTKKAKEVGRRYEKSDKERKKVVRERKVDAEKGGLLTAIKTAVEAFGGIVSSVKNEAEFSFTFNGNSYTVKLVKHRPPKKGAVTPGPTDKDIKKQALLDEMEKYK